MKEARVVTDGLRAVETIEGAGVRLHRVLGNNDAPRFDPFLLLDDFSSDDPADYLSGFPWHPHRGIETVTYIRKGLVEHGDSLGNSGSIGDGEVQWMTAGSGIIHQEMPGNTKRLAGFQLWVNLPAANKMMKPRYRDVPANRIPEAGLGAGVSALVISGEAGGIRGPVADIVVDIMYLDVAMEAGRRAEIPVKRSHTCVTYCYEGSVRFGGRVLAAGEAASHGNGDLVVAETRERGARFLLCAGEPIGEPVAWRGPIVMNTVEELDRAYSEIERGTFIRP
jgi:quercetin 2,3-dioxygenase